MRSGILLLGVIPLAIDLIISDLNSQETPQAPQIQTEDKTNSTLESKEQGQHKETITDKAAVPFPQHVPSISNEKSGGNTDKSEEEGNEFWPPFFGYKIKITDSLLSLFTFGLFVATWFLFRATRDLVVSAEETSKRQLRAYISVEPRGIGKRDANGPPAGFIRARNVGATPAHNVKVAIKMDILEKLPDTDITGTAIIIIYRRYDYNAQRV